MTKFPANCMIVALAMWVRHPLTTKVRCIRSSGGCLHFVWRRAGQNYDFFPIVCADDPERKGVPWGAKGGILPFKYIFFVGEIRKIGCVWSYKKQRIKLLW